MKPIAIFFHGLFYLGDRHMPNAGCIIRNQITQMVNSGLWEAANYIHFGINGDEESKPITSSIIPHDSKVTVTLHGLQCRTENRTVEMLLDWAKTHPGWNILYLHGKGASHPPDSEYANRVSQPWREAMMQDLVVNWRQCVADLETHDIACMVWLWEQGWDKSQHVSAGNLLWLTSDFAAKLPSLYLRGTG